MKRLVKYGLRVFGVATIAAMLGAGAGLAPAHADPHAVFWTVVGQQQLFFNVLAALNQADYVESLDLRNQLAQKRDAANYAPSSAAALKETQTDLADLVTRDVTLEGQDVRTQERSDDYAREVVRQRQLADLISKLCREAFGNAECEVKPENALDPQKGSQLLTERKRAFVTDPLEYEAIPITHGALAALLSGTPAYQDIAKQVIDEAKNGGQVLPLAYSPEIAKLREANPELFNAQIDDVVATYLASGLNLGQWRNYVGVDQSGSVTFTPANSVIDKNHGRNRPVTADEVLQMHLLATDGGLTVSQSVESIAEAARERVALQLQTVDGAVPDRVQKVQTTEDGKIGEVQLLFSAPALVKKGLMEGLLLALLDVEANPQFIDPSQIDNPAGESAVDRQGKGPLKIGSPLEPFQKADVIERGLLQNSGITAKAGMPDQNFLQQVLAAIIDKLNR